jgi:ATPase family associated with various cellular activities (AAA)
MIAFAILSILTSFQLFLIAPLLIGHLFRIQGYKITDQTECNTLIKKLNIKRSTFVQNDKPFGFFYGKWYFGYICSQESSTQQNSGQVMYIVLRRTHFEAIKKCSEIEIGDNGEQVDQKIIKIRERRGNPWWWEYTERQYNATKYLQKEPRDYQSEIIKDMLSIVDGKASKSGTFFIYGEPGTGKSLLTLLLAKQIGAYYCDSWKPTDPGDTLSRVYSAISPDEEKPLVLVLEECDKILFDVLDGKIVQHKHILIQVREKSDWNGMLDKVTDLGFYPHTILILTSNVNLDKINERDKSLLRKGRIDKSYHISL